MSAQHTQGLLEVKTHTYGIADTGDYDSVFEIWGNGKAIAWFGGSDEDEANARRLVACWNACDRIQTETLELVPYFGEAGIRTIESVEKERDELLVALQYAIRQVPELATVPGIAAAIAKAEGGAA